MKLFEFLKNNSGKILLFFNNILLMALIVLFFKSVDDKKKEITPETVTEEVANEAVLEQQNKYSATRNEKIDSVKPAEEQKLTETKTVTVQKKVPQIVKTETTSPKTTKSSKSSTPATKTS